MSICISGLAVAKTNPYRHFNAVGNTFVRVYNLEQMTISPVTDNNFKNQGELLVSLYSHDNAANECGSNHALLVKVHLYGM